MPENRTFSAASSQAPIHTRGRPAKCGAYSKNRVWAATTRACIIMAGVMLPDLA